MWPLFWRSFDIFSLAGFRYLTDQLEAYGTVNASDGDFVEILRLIAEVVTYGDQHDPAIFELFMEKQTMAQFVRILNISKNSGVTIQLLQTLSIMIQNLRNEHAIYYLFSNEYINYLMKYPFEFENEELVPYYISFLRTISGKLDRNTISLLVKTQQDAVVSFPLYSEAIKFAHYTDTMVRTAVRALTLAIYRVGDESVNKFITSPTMFAYFSDLVKFLKEKSFKLDALVVHAVQVDDASEITAKMFSIIEEIGDDLYYCSDIICAGISDLSRLMTQNLLHLLVLQDWLPSLNLSHPNMTTPTSLYLMSRLLQVINKKELVNTIATAFLCPQTLATTSLNPECHGHSIVGGLPIESTKVDAGSGIPMVNTSIQTEDQQSQGNSVGPLETQFMNIALLDTSDKDKRTSSSGLLSLVFCENNKLVLASLSLLAVLLQSKEMDSSLLDVPGILPQRVQHKKVLQGEPLLCIPSNELGLSQSMLMCQIFDTLMRLLCWTPLSAETAWHAGWLFQNLLPYYEKKFNVHHFNAAYESARDDLMKEVNDSCCDLLPSAILEEWKECKKALEIPALQKDFNFILLPDPRPHVPDGDDSSYFIKERMLAAVKVFVLFHQLMNFILRSTVPENPPTNLLKDSPACSRGKDIGVDTVALKVGVSVNLGDAIPCRIAFEEGKELHVHMLTVVKGAFGWLLLAEKVHDKPHHGIVVAIAPLAGLKPKIDENHQRWLQLRIRADDMASLDSQIVGMSSSRYRTYRVPDGKWILAFSDEQACKYARSIILEEIARQSSFVKRALESMLIVDVATKSTVKSPSDLNNTQTANL